MSLLLALDGAPPAPTRVGQPSRVTRSGAVPPRQGAACLVGPRCRTLPPPPPARRPHLPHVARETRRPSTPGRVVQSGPRRHVPPVPPGPHPVDRYTQLPPYGTVGGRYGDFSRGAPAAPTRPPSLRMLLAAPTRRRARGGSGRLMRPVPPEEPPPGAPSPSPYIPTFRRRRR